MAFSAAPFCCGESASVVVVLTPRPWNQVLTVLLKNSRLLSVCKRKTGKFKDLNDKYTC